MKIQKMDVHVIKSKLDTPFAFSPTLIEEALPHAKDVVEAVKSLMYR